MQSLKTPRAEPDFKNKEQYQAKRGSKTYLLKPTTNENALVKLSHRR
jgi:hypothetical protein